MHDRDKSGKTTILSRAKKTALHGVYTISPPPKELDIKAASVATLLRHGLFVRRPSPNSEPKLFKAWNRAISELWRAETFIPPLFEPQIGVTHQLRTLTQTDSGLTSNNWSGAAIVGNWSGAFGQWTIPTVSKPQTAARPDGQWHSSSWVGLDGLGGGRPGGNSTDVLQAGVTQIVDAQGQASYVAWYEWFAPGDQPDGSYSQDFLNKYPYVFQTNINIPVHPGDNVAVAVQYVQHRGDNIGNPLPPPGPYAFGGVQFGNLTTGKYFPIYLDPPSTASLSGDSAEWIMELNDGGTGTLPVFTDINFETAGACNSSNSPSPIKASDLITLEEDLVHANTAESTGDASVTISYRKP